MADKPTYADVRDEVERILLTMVEEGRAELWGVGPHGPLFRVNTGDAVDRAGERGLVDNSPFELAAAIARMQKPPEDEEL